MTRDINYMCKLLANILTTKSEHNILDDEGKDKLVTLDSVMTDYIYSNRGRCTSYNLVEVTKVFLSTIKRLGRDYNLKKTMREVLGVELTNRELILAMEIIKELK